MFICTNLRKCPNPVRVRPFSGLLNLFIYPKQKLFSNVLLINKKKWTRSSKMNAIARTAQRLDAEYDGGHSDVGDDSADSEDSPLKLQTANSRCTARAKHAFRLSRAGR
jgi:hypothetical protein